MGVAGIEGASSITGSSGSGAATGAGMGAGSGGGAAAGIAMAGGAGGGARPTSGVGRASRSVGASPTNGLYWALIISVSEESLRMRSSICSSFASSAPFSVVWLSTVLASFAIFSLMSLTFASRIAVSSATGGAAGAAGAGAGAAAGAGAGAAAVAGVAMAAAGPAGAAGAAGGAALGSLPRLKSFMPSSLLIEGEAAERRSAGCGGSRAAASAERDGRVGAVGGGRLEVRIHRASGLRDEDHLDARPGRQRAAQVHGELHEVAAGHDAAVVGPADPRRGEPGAAIRVGVDVRSVRVADDELRQVHGQGAGRQFHLRVDGVDVCGGRVAHAVDASHLQVGRDLLGRLLPGGLGALLEGAGGVDQHRGSHGRDEDHRDEHDERAHADLGMVVRRAAVGSVRFHRWGHRIAGSLARDI